MLRILEEHPPRKYYLSKAACLGILRRAEQRGKALPPQLKEALEHMGKGALRIYRERFTGEIFARNIEAVYLRALEGENKE